MYGNSNSNATDILSFWRFQMPRFDFHTWQCKSIPWEHTLLANDPHSSCNTSLFKYQGGLQALIIFLLIFIGIWWKETFLICLSQVVWKRSESLSLTTLATALHNLLIAWSSFSPVFWSTIIFLYRWLQMDSFGG